MTNKAFLLFALASTLLAACPDPTDETKLDLGATECVAPASLGYECPNGNCPDAQGCNWCNCDTTGSSWGCTARACTVQTPDAGASTGCQKDSDCGGDAVCRFVAGCAPTVGGCFSPGEKFFYGCALTQSQATTACLCDGTTQQLQVDCSGASKPFAHLGACK